MAKYEVRVRYAFEGTYKVVAEDRDEAERIVTEVTLTCRSFLSGNGLAKARSDTRPCVSATGLKN